MKLELDGRYIDYMLKLLEKEQDRLEREVKFNGYIYDEIRGQKSSQEQ